MTIPEDTTTQEPETEVAEETYYLIDVSDNRPATRSLPGMLLTRRCPTCRARLEESGDLPSPEVQIQEIAQDCSNEDGFIRPEMPMQEIMFRAILAGSNQPISLTNLHGLITDRWYTPTNARSISIESLKRVLDTDTYYGFQQVSGADQESQE